VHAQQLGQSLLHEDVDLEHQLFNQHRSMQGVTTKEECLARRNGEWPRSSRICVSRGPVGFYLKMN